MAIDQVIARIRRALLLDTTAFEEARDDVAFTPMALGALAIAVLIAGFGAFLWSETAVDGAPDGWFVDTFILGSIFTFILFLAGMGITYVMLTQVYKASATPDALARVVSIGYLPFAIGALVLIPEIGFAFGLFSIAAMFYLTVAGIRAAFPNVEELQALISTSAGFAVWAIILLLISNNSGDSFATGIFVYGLFD